MSKPIKRSGHLIQLSREHHFSLLFCWKVRTGIKKNIEKRRIIPYILFFGKNIYFLTLKKRMYYLKK